MLALDRMKHGLLISSHSSLQIVKISKHEAVSNPHLWDSAPSEYLCPRVHVHTPIKPDQCGSVLWKDAKKAPRTHQSHPFTKEVISSNNSLLWSHTNNIPIGINLRRLLEKVPWTSVIDGPQRRESTPSWHVHHLHLERRQSSQPEGQVEWWVWQKGWRREAWWQWNWTGALMSLQWDFGTMGTTACKTGGPRAVTHTGAEHYFKSDQVIAQRWPGSSLEIGLVFTSLSFSMGIKIKQAFQIIKNICKFLFFLESITEK